MNQERTNRGRSDEARDPNRPIDPETGEKVGLGDRKPAEPPTEEPTEPEEPAAPEEPAPPR